MLERNDSELWDLDKDVTFTNKLLLMDSPAKIFLIWSLYMIFICKVGPDIMKNRPAYSLNVIITTYNALQVLLSGWVVCMGAQILWTYGLKPKCLDNTDDSIGYLSTVHFYYLLKITELLDTVFFVLRKKFNQASFLHIYHHSYMLLSTWLIIKYDPTYAMLFPAVLNSFIHVIMYTYYGLSAFPRLARYLWWKKYITFMQLIQFVMIIFHIFGSYYTSRCPPSFLMAYSIIANVSIFIVLFSDFYVRSYNQSRNT